MHRATATTSSAKATHTSCFTGTWMVPDGVRSVPTRQHPTALYMTAYQQTRCSISGTTRGVRTSVFSCMTSPHDARYSIEPTTPHSSDPMPLNIIGKNYTELNMRDSAEHYLHRSTLRCPNRLYPHYLLMKLYLKEPTDSTAARREAKILLSTKEKVPSPAVEQMRKEAEFIIDE